ncbi:MAG: hypothetical protein J7J65_02915 [Candidatus Korarchaeota archaeon]|nr:hypothetical protein [Candidatus Korarchaeota archaeon]
MAKKRPTKLIPRGLSGLEALNSWSIASIIMNHKGELTISKILESEFHLTVKAHLTSNMKERSVMAKQRVAGIPLKAKIYGPKSRKADHPDPKRTSLT